MARELTGAIVAARLQWLRDAYVPLTEAEARLRMTPPRTHESFVEGAARRVEELRALMELTEALQSPEGPLTLTPAADRSASTRRASPSR